MAARDMTPKQLHFCRCVASGMTQADAYREAYEPSDSTTAASIHTLASRLMGQVEIRSRVDTLIAAKRARCCSFCPLGQGQGSEQAAWMDGLRRAH